MLVKLFDTGTGKAKSAINYLLGDKDHSGKTRSVKPEVLDGDPKTIAQLIDSTDRKWKYTSGAIAFRDGENPSSDDLRQVMEGFEAAFFPALEKDKNFSVLWVLHKDKGNTELHFLIPRTEEVSGRSLNIHPPGKKSLAHFKAWTAVMNQALGYAQVVPDPLKLSLSGFQLKSPDFKPQAKKMQNIHKVLENKIRNGSLKNRDELCTFLEKQGIEINRRGEDYISIGVPGREKSKRFKGEIYSRNANYQDILMRSNKAREPKKLSHAEFLTVRDNLHSLIKERKDFNIKAFLTKKTPRYMKHFSKVSAQVRGKPKATSMGKLSAPLLKQPVDFQKLSQLQKVSAAKPSQSIFNSLISKTHSSSSGSGVGPPSAVTDVTSIQIAIGNVQGNIDAAIAEVATAKSPAQRASAQQKLAALMMQKMRLEAQLGQAKKGEINRLRI